jgi:hypothetical protein
LAQKSLPTINKIGASMLWYSTYYYKYYKWLSSQYMYMALFLNKLFVFLDLFCMGLFWVNYSNKYFCWNEKFPKTITVSKIRFFFPVTSYLVQTKDSVIFFGLYYKSTLERFQALNVWRTPFHESSKFTLLHKHPQKTFFLN